MKRLADEISNMRKEFKEFQDNTRKQFEAIIGALKGDRKKPDQSFQNLSASSLNFYDILEQSPESERVAQVKSDLEAQIYESILPQTNISHITPIQQQAKISHKTRIPQQTNISHITPIQQENISHNTHIPQQTNMSTYTPYTQQDLHHTQTFLPPPRPVQYSTINLAPLDDFVHVGAQPQPSNSQSVPTASTASFVDPFDPKWQYFKDTSNGRDNYAWIVAQQVYPPAELHGHRVKGTEEHPALCKTKLSQVKKIVMMFFPLQLNENPTKAWRSCEKNLDTNLRRKPKSKAKKTKE